MNFKDLIGWVKGFFIEVKHESYIRPTKPVDPWPFPVVIGTPDSVKKPAKKKPIVKDKVIKDMKKAAPKNETAKKAAVKRAKKGK